MALNTISKSRTAAALLRNFGRARVAPRYWYPSVRIARQAIGGFGAMQKQAELAPLVALVMRLHPDRVLEIGTARGGTLWAWCQVARENAVVVSVDLPGGPFGGKGYDASLVRSYAGPRQTLELLAADSHASETKAEVQTLLGGPLDFLFIDGDHGYDGVRLDYTMYSPLVRPGGLVALHDIVPGAAEYVGGYHASGTSSVVSLKLVRSSMTSGPADRSSRAVTESGLSRIGATRRPARSS